VLARANRIVRGDDFKRIVRKGARRATPHALLYVAAPQTDSTRFGFIVSKAVGNAVVRNRMARRLRAIGADYLSSGAPVRDVVIRALPGSPEASWVTLRSEILVALDRGTSPDGSPRGPERERSVMTQ